MQNINTYELEGYEAPQDIKRILDQDGNEMEGPDYTKGHLVEERLFIKHHEAVEAVQEQGHYETVKEYPNGGKDVEWVVDVPGVEAAEAFDEYEDVLRFVPFTKKELAGMRIGELKQKLSETDYNILKIVEGAATLVSCAEVIKQRAAWRKEINELEEEYNGKL